MVVFGFGPRPGDHAAAAGGRPPLRRRPAGGGCFGPGRAPRTSPRGSRRRRQGPPSHRTSTGRSGSGTGRSNALVTGVSPSAGSTSSVAWVAGDPRVARVRAERRPPPDLSRAEPTSTAWPSPGDFNVELAWDDLRAGANTLRVLARWRDGARASALVRVLVERGRTWPLPYRVDFARVTDLQAAAQVVDGEWRLTGDGARTTTRWYDRVLAVGDGSWTDYEATVLLTLHGFTPAQRGPPDPTTYPTWGSVSAGRDTPTTSCSPAGSGTRSAPPPSSSSNPTGGAGSGRPRRRWRPFRPGEGGGGRRRSPGSPVSSQGPGHDPARRALAVPGPALERRRARAGRVGGGEPRGGGGGSGRRIRAGGSAQHRRDPARDPGRAGRVPPAGRGDLVSDRALIVFLKHPEPGTVKTRLIPALGPEVAAGSLSGSRRDGPGRPRSGPGEYERLVFLPPEAAEAVQSVAPGRAAPPAGRWRPRGADERGLRPGLRPGSGAGGDRRDRLAGGVPGDRGGGPRRPGRRGRRPRAGRGWWLLPAGPPSSPSRSCSRAWPGARRRSSRRPWPARRRRASGPRARPPPRHRHARGPASGVAPAYGALLEARPDLVRRVEARLGGYRYPDRRRSGWPR